MLFQAGCTGAEELESDGVLMCSVGCAIEGYEGKAEEGEGETYAIAKEVQRVASSDS